MGERELAAERNEADAEIERLCAIRDELLDSVEQLLRTVPYDPGNRERTFWREHARAVIKKAKEQP